MVDGVVIPDGYGYSQEAPASELEAVYRVRIKGSEGWELRLPIMRRLPPHTPSKPLFVADFYSKAYGVSKSTTLNVARWAYALCTNGVLLSMEPCEAFLSLLLLDLQSGDIINDVAKLLTKTIAFVTESDLHLIMPPAAYAALAILVAHPTLVLESADVELLLSDYSNSPSTDDAPHITSAAVLEAMYMLHAGLHRYRVACAAARKQALVTQLMLEPSPETETTLRNELELVDAGAVGRKKRAHLDSYSMLPSLIATAINILFVGCSIKDAETEADENLEHGKGDGGCGETLTLFREELGLKSVCYNPKLHKPDFTTLKANVGKHTPSKNNIALNNNTSMSMSGRIHLYPVAGKGRSCVELPLLPTFGAQVATLMEYVFDRVRKTFLSKAGGGDIGLNLEDRKCIACCGPVAACETTHTDMSYHQSHILYVESVLFGLLKIDSGCGRLLRLMEAYPNTFVKPPPLPTTSLLRNKNPQPRQLESLAPLPIGVSSNKNNAWIIPMPNTPIRAI
jgi:hypothetical protein